MNVLIGFEESQTSCAAFLKRGHNAFSCDIQETSGQYPDRHLRMDIFAAIKLMEWDLIILHPPCTYTALCGNRWYYDSPLRQQGARLCKDSWDAARSVCNRVALEQPKTIMQKYIGPKTQAIQPWQFGHGETKETWLWLHGLPKLQPTQVVDGRDDRIFRMPPSPNRGKERSRTYQGIADAFADQWG